ncbi:MAG TPA: ribonuclease P protein component [bacterium]|nr:ribonuclease P protein component [bacterium]
MRRGRLGRLRRRAEYSRVYREGLRYPGNAVVLFFRSTGTPWKVGVTAGRGVGGAVARNRAKRRLREALRRLEACLSRQGEIVLVARPLAGTARFSDIVEELEALCRAGHLLREGNG